MKAPLKRFEATVAYGPGCMLWRGHRDATGYGKCSNGRNITTAQRRAYELYRGPVPSGWQVDHLCRTRACVNIQHLEAVTCKVNLLRGVGFPAINASKTPCKPGPL